MADNLNKQASRHGNRPATRALAHGLGLGVAGAVAALAMAPIFWWWALFISIPAAIAALDALYEDVPLPKRALSGMVLGWWWGFGYFLAGLYWISNALLVDMEQFGWMAPFTTVLLPAGLALFTALAFGLMSLVWSRGSGRLIMFATIFVAIEGVRGIIFTGFPWNGLHQGFAGSVTMMQIISVVGPLGVSLILALCATAPAALFEPMNRKGAFVPVLAAVVVLLGIAFFGSQRIERASDAVYGDTRVRIVQPNINQKDKWRPDMTAAIVDRLMSLTRPQGKAAQTIVVWPEAAVPFRLERAAGVLYAVGQQLGGGDYLIAGTNRTQINRDGTQRHFNGMSIVNGAGRVVGHYNKHHLVPFGEYIPLRSVLGATGLSKVTQGIGDFSAGEGPQTKSIGAVPPFSPQICYEAIFPGEAVPQDGPRPAWMVNVTNDAWYGDSPGPHQHLAQARLRAVEQGMAMARSANTGISALIDPYGRVVDALPLGETGVIEAWLPQPIAPTAYSEHGDWPAWGALLVIFGFGLGMRRRSKGRRDLAQ